jgi:hypothetical protein
MHHVIVISIQTKPRRIDISPSSQQQSSSSFSLMRVVADGNDDGKIQSLKGRSADKATAQQMMTSSDRVVVMTMTTNERRRG